MTNKPIRRNNLERMARRWQREMNDVLLRDNNDYETMVALTDSTIALDLLINHLARLRNLLK